MNKKILFEACLGVSLLFVCAQGVFAQEYFVIDKGQSQVEVSVRYTVIGRYEAEFNNFDGEIILDRKDTKNMAVNMRIKIDSVDSGNTTFDNIVKSERLLDAQKYDVLQFKSTLITKKERQYFVTGIFDLHGVSKEMTFPFQLEGPIIDYPKDPYLKASGTWKINRKDFGVIWHKHLDKGGVVVGNYVMIDWEVIAVKK